jgi:hypothetical protein
LLSEALFSEALLFFLPKTFEKKSFEARPMASPFFAPGSPGNFAQRQGFSFFFASGQGPASLP